MRLFHYTTFSRLQKIVATGIIRQATIMMDRKEKPTVWLSSAAMWEPTATKLLEDKETGEVKRITFDEMAALETPVRIEVQPKAATMDWSTWCTRSGVSAKSAEALKKTAEDQGSNVAGWRMSFNAIPSKKWLAIELFVNGRWQDMEKFKPQD